MAYDITGDLALALQQVQDRYNERYADPERSTTSKLANARLEEDGRRLELIKQLQTLAADPNRSAAINSAADAQNAMLRQNANDAAGSALGNVTLQSALTGMLGGSRLNRQRGQIAVGRDDAVRQGATMVQDWKQGIHDADNANIMNTLNGVLAPTTASQGANQAMLSGMQTNLGLGQQLSEVRQQQNQILAQTIGGFMQNTVAPSISGMYQVAAARREADRYGMPRQSAWDVMMSGGGQQNTPYVFGSEYRPGGYGRE